VGVAEPLEHALVRLGAALAGRAAWETRLTWGRRLGRLWWGVDPRHRRIAQQNLARAFPDRPEEWVRGTAVANFEHLGATAVEFGGMFAETPDSLLARYRFEGRERLDRVLEEGRGALLLTAHLGNWELAGLAMAALGYPFHAVGRRLRNPRIDAWVRSMRERFGGRVIPHRQAVRPVLRALRSGGLVAFLMDQRALSREGVPSVFFGRPVSTNRGLATLALRTGAPVLPAFDRREGAGHVAWCEPPLEPPPDGPPEQRIREFTRRFDRVIEEAVRRVPEQWFWVHRRWRLPKGMTP